jgi:putative tricarboxylic transport membrane protein
MDRLEIRQIHPASIPGLVPMMLAAALCCAYALVLVGRLPFFIATALFVAAFVAAFRPSGRPWLRHGVMAAGFGIATAVTVSALFRYGFLVRLPCWTVLKASLPHSPASRRSRRCSMSAGRRCSASSSDRCPG